MKGPGIVFLVLICLFTLSCCAGEIALLSPQKEYFFLTGQESALPLTLNNTYGHDITGLLRFSTASENGGSGAAVTMQEKTFTVFTGKRPYLLPAGRSEAPLVLRGDIVFLYPDNGGRRASLEGIVIRFVNNTAELRADADPQESTDMPDPAAGSAGMSVSGATSPPSDPLQKVRNNQPGQDITGLQQQLRQEDEESLRLKKAFLSLVMQDPVIAGIDRSLSQEGFSPAGSDAVPDTGIAGNFSLSYEKQGRPAVVRGSIANGSLLFADESSGIRVPLPAPLPENATFRSFERELAGAGFSRNTTLVHYTPGAMTVNLTYGDAGGRTALVKAVIASGTITGIERRVPEELPPYLVLVLSLAFICLLFGGIVFLARRLPRSPPPKPEKPVPEPGRPAGYRTEAGMLLDEAETMAEKGLFPGAYAGAGRALRLVLSHRMGDGREITNEEALRLLATRGAGGGQAGALLGRSSEVAFAKGTPDPEEFSGILKFIRDLLASEDPSGKTRG